MANIFAQLQMLSTVNVDNTVIQSRKQLQEIVEFFKNRETYLEEVTIFATKTRNLNVDTLLSCDSFMVQPDVLLSEIPEHLRHDSLGFCNGYGIIFSGRYIYPVKDVKGNVMGFCGYDMFEDPKYLDSKNYGYIAKQYSVWGMEELPKYYKSTDPVYFVEGIVCALYLRQCGMQALATLGSYITPYVCQIINRFGSRAVFVCDSDEAGIRCRKQLRRTAPLVRVVQSCIAKDVDDSRKVDSAFAEELRKMLNPFYRSSLFK